MLLLPIQLCQPGMRLGKPIFNDEGLILLNEGMELTPTIVQRLEQFGINQVYIEDPRTDDIVLRDVVSQETRARAVAEVRSTFGRLMDASFRKKSMNGLQLGRTFKPVIDTILDDITSNVDAMMMLANIHASDHYLFQHSVDVCIYAAIMGQASGYSRDELFNLAIGALLHDIGKTQLPDHLLQKPGRLTPEEYEKVKTHTTLGFQMLKDEPNIPLLSAHVAFQHHERLNGSGYPRAIEGEEIHEYARWVGLADSYDAMTTHRVYRKAMLPHEAVEVLYAGAGTLFDRDMVKLFRNKVAIYPLGMLLRINTGEIGVVVDINASTPHRPIIRILYDEVNQPISPYEIDLSKVLHLQIVEVNPIVPEQWNSQKTV